MDQSTTHWVSTLQPVPQSTLPNRQDYCHNIEDYAHAGQYGNTQPPPYEDITFKDPRLPRSENSRPTLHREFDNAPYRAGTVQPLGIGLDASSDDSLHEALDFAQRAPPPQNALRKLRLPVAIPQVVPGLGLPFARCYSEELQGHGVSVAEFTKFIDNLNVVSAGSPPLQIVDLAGGVVGMIPFQHAQLISFGIQSVARVGKAAVSKTRGSRFLSKANEDFFNPRGLKVELVTSDALKFKLKMDSGAALTTNGQELNDLGMLERRVAALRGYASPVTFDVPPPDQQTNILNKMSAAQQKGVMAKQEKKFMKERVKHAKEDGGYDGRPGSKRQEIELSMQGQMEKSQRNIDRLNEEFDQKLRKKPKDASKIERERSKEVEKVEKEARKEVEDLEKKLQKADKKRQKHSEKSDKDDKKADKETKALNKIQWILVEDMS